MSFGLVRSHTFQPPALLNMKPKRKKGTRWGSPGSLPAAIRARRAAICRRTGGSERVGGELSGQRAGNHGSRRHGVPRREMETIGARQNGTHGGSALGYIPEMAWNDTITWNAFETGPGAGGDRRRRQQLVSEASWQVGPGSSGRRPAGCAGYRASRHRTLHDPYNIVTSGQTIQVGGTSAATPVFAGMLTLLNQSLKQNGAGNINASLYGLALSSPSMFHDIVNNNNIVPMPHRHAGL